ncbi:MAG: very short patch repair endonuclease [Kiritimatiellia bacterium]
MDRVTPEQRSEIMSAIHSRDTLPEIVMRKWLFAQGCRFRVCDKKIVGCPDVVLPRLKTLIEVRGCFWHHHGWAWDGRRLVQREACGQATVPKTNRAFWNEKFRRNVRRDQEHERLWAEQGWNVIVVWECGLRTAQDREQTFAHVARWLRECERTRDRAAPRRPPAGRAACWCCQDGKEKQ